MNRRELHRLYDVERKRFARVFPRCASTVLEIVPRYCPVPGCELRNVAYADWAGPDTRIVIVERLLKMPRENIVAVLRHELGHHLRPDAVP